MGSIMNKLTALAAMIMLISASALDSADWKKPFIIFAVSGLWCVVYAVHSYYFEEV